MIPYGRQSIGRAEIAAVSAILESDYLTQGPLIDQFEAALCQATGSPYAVVCSSGTAALHLAALAIKTQSGKTSLSSITSPITFVASANCIEYIGGTNNFLDISLESLGLDLDLLEQRCKSGNSPECVVYVDFAGVCGDLARLKALSESYSFKVIEDAAHALGSTYTVAGKSHTVGCGSHSDITILSFHPVKTITTAEGGALLSANKELADIARKMRSHGIEREPAKLTRHDGPWYHEMNALGYHYRLTDIQCALGLSQLNSLAKFRERRQAIVKMYNQAFGGIEQLIIPPWPKDQSPCYHLYPLQFREGSNRRRFAYDFLKEHGIGTQVHYIPVYQQPYYSQKYGFKIGKCPNAELYYSRCLSLPLYPDLSEAQVQHVISSVLASLVHRE